MTLSSSHIIIIFFIVCFLSIIYELFVDIIYERQRGEWQRGEWQRGDVKVKDDGGNDSVKIYIPIFDIFLGVRKSFLTF